MSGAQTRSGLATAVLSQHFAASSRGSQQTHDDANGGCLARTIQSQQRRDLSAWDS